MALNVSLVKEKTINTEVKDFNYIPAYKEYEKERQENEKERQAYYEDIQRRVNNGEFNGKDGEVGPDGKTPVKGTDYWTEADKEEIKEFIDEDVADLETLLRNILLTIQNGGTTSNTIAEIEQLIVSYFENKTVGEVEI
jgi:hypothetical protein